MGTSLTQARISLKKIALPASHGGWGFLLEPILLGLWVAPSLAGVWLGLAALGAFLAQQPLKLTVGDWRKGRRYARTAWAERFSLLYGLVALAAFVLAIAGARASFWLPLGLAAPLAVVQLYYDVSNRGRAFIPELLGAAALGAVAAAMALAAGWATAPALALWGILLTRALVSIVYVRARLRLERGQTIAAAPVWVVHLLGLLALAGLAFGSLIPWLAVLALLVLLIRAVAGLSSYRRAVRARTVGFQELGYGLLTVTLTALGYTFNL